MHRRLIALLGTVVLIGTGVAARQNSPAIAEVPQTRLEQDLRAMERYRPGYPFWQQVFTVPDGSIVFGSATDGRVLAVFPAKGDWKASARWMDSSFERVLDGSQLPVKIGDRRDYVAGLLENVAGPVLHNPARGLFATPNVKLYGGFLAEWARIYERFGVPSEVGLAQALVESGLSGTRRSPARALGFCQFLESNLRHLNRLAPYVIEGRNQTSQAPYCAAYLSILATRYGSFIPALSDHHSGGANVGRTLINGERLGAEDVRDQYFTGSQFARDLRQIDLYGYRDIYRTYGPRSYLYAEMVFGNMARVRELTAASKTPESVNAMRVSRPVALADVAKRARLSTSEVKRYNPALVKQVPAGGTVYLPAYIKELGTDVAFWRKPPSAAYSATLADFMQLPSGPERWDSVEFEPVLVDFQRRFRLTNTEEGTVMATTLGFVIDDARTSGRREMIARFRTSPEVQQLFDRAVLERDAANGTAIAACRPGAAAAVGVQRVSRRAC